MLWRFQRTKCLEAGVIFETNQVEVPKNSTRFDFQISDNSLDETWYIVPQKTPQEVKWFEASYLRRQLLSADKDSADDFNIPSKTSLAHSLIQGWLQEVES